MVVLRAFTACRATSERAQAVRSLPVLHRPIAQSRRYATPTPTPPTKTFANQSKIPRLPVPTLDNLSKKFLASCEPLLNQEQLERTTKIVEQFVSNEGLGPKLQELLTRYETEQKNSWLEDIWLKKAYLEWREPSMINVNWWGQFKDHPRHPKDLLRKPPPKGVLSTFQIQRAAGLISNMLNFKDLVDTERLPAEYMKDKPLDMNQYKSQFGATRIPKKGCDEIRTVWPARSRHIIVLTRDQVYRVEVIRADNTRVPLKELERLLFAVGQDSLHTELEPSVGFFTGAHRDTWAEAHEKLRWLSASNAENLEIIDQALFAVCLDNHSLSKNIDVSHRQVFHNDGRNRWFDKAMQLVVASNGRAGVNGEHTPADAVIPGKVFDYILSNEPAVDPPNSEGTSLPPPQKLKWVINDELQTLLDKARAEGKALIDDTESCLLQTDVYGARYIKEVGQASPDAYVQLALQLAWRRYPNANGQPSDPTAVYESASTRLFLHGRTETGRSLTSDTWKFVESFDNDDVLYETKRTLFTRAIASQSAYMRDAAFGKGIDRHFTALRYLLEHAPTILTQKQSLLQSAKDPVIITDLKSHIKTLESVIELSQDPTQVQLFDAKTDPAGFWKSQHWKLSTSNMSPGRYFYGGFGTVYPDGYGINYAIDTDTLKFSISAKKSCTTTNPFTFRDTLERTLKDMMILFPKRSEVWGKGWKEEREREGRERAYLGIMKGLSDGYVGRKEVLERKYKPKAPEGKEE
ncbi:acyltransferase ChoActase/COT/CPT [Fimicolochytrium jonesii]|uniref:acyltransferase ChoActase/COT/CPT n=1 Tax=Fimicolochytrium jonesii TaxID=1396493 RepID=UPI0022FDC046|nr:acyltransferase ChoActase/COT/CPT [Fimicolochytrium jonesii]KAI8820843.1 acyltransferase ChoActase/COT/CPT [Fimicolochytrium jonesii]